MPALTDSPRPSAELRRRERSLPNQVEAVLARLGSPVSDLRGPDLARRVHEELARLQTRLKTPARTRPGSTG